MGRIVLVVKHILCFILSFFIFLFIIANLDIVNKNIKEDILEDEYYENITKIEELKVEEKELTIEKVRNEEMNEVNNLRSEVEDLETLKESLQDDIKEIENKLK